MTRCMAQYDSSAGVLYVSMGRPRRAVSIEDQPGTLVRVDPHTASVVGFTLILGPDNLDASRIRLRPIMESDSGLELLKAVMARLKKTGKTRIAITAPADFHLKDRWANEVLSSGRGSKSR